MAYSVKDILKIEVAPALGCTEPAAIALGAASARTLLQGADPDRIEIWVDPNIYKNAMSASIPGAVGMSGLDMAAALGALGGDPALKLEVLQPVDEQTARIARRFIEAGKVKVNLLRNQQGLYIRSVLKCGGHTAESIIKDVHDNLVSLILNGEDVTENVLLAKGSLQHSKQLADLEAWLKKLSLEELLGFVEELDSEDLKFLEQGVQTNIRLAEFGLNNGSGMGVGLTLQEMAREGLLKRDMVLAARIITSAGADARMSGVKLPAMSSAGSGNHGLTAILPIYAVKEFVECDQKAFLKAVCLSHLVTAYIKAHTGRLSAVCGCSVAAGAGAGAGITYLLGGDARMIAGAVTNLMGDLAGVICDGAKPSCAFKLSTAAGTAVQAALFARRGVGVHPNDGITGLSFEQTSQNIGELSVQGMIETDRAILGIMLKKQFLSGKS